MAKKDKNKASEIIDTITDVKNEVVEAIESTFDFGDKDIVTLIGTGIKGFSMKPNIEYKEIGKVAKILIKKGAAKLK